MQVNRDNVPQKVHRKKATFSLLEDVYDEVDLLGQLKNLKKKIRDLLGPSGTTHEKQSRKGDQGKKAHHGAQVFKTQRGGGGWSRPIAYFFVFEPSS